jgi:hypothetical protein
MQIQNFYSDWLPAPTSALDNIVLSPHTIKTNDSKLTGMQDDYCDSHTRVCIYDLSHLDPFTPAQESYSGTCRLKKCMNWFRKRSSSRREKE